MFKKIKNKLKKLFSPKTKSLREKFVDLIKSFPQIYGDDHYGDKLPTVSYKDWLWNKIISSYLFSTDRVLRHDFLNDAPKKHAQNMLLDFHNKNILPLFVRFLKEENKWFEFQYNINNPRNRLMGYKGKLYELLPSDYLGKAFTWRNTHQGHDAWSLLNVKWVKFLNQIFELN